MKICHYHTFNIKIIYWRFHIKSCFTFWDIRTWDMSKVCLQTFRNNRVCSKLAYFLRNLLNSWKILWEFMGFRIWNFQSIFFIWTQTQYRDYQICIVYLSRWNRFFLDILKSQIWQNSLDISLVTWKPSFLAAVAQITNDCFDFLLQS